MSAIDRIIIRSLQPDDSIPVVTKLLHAAYRPLAAKGLKFHASHQDDDVTLERLSSGYPLVAELDGQLVATITRYGPDLNSPCLWFRQPDIQWLGQLAVRPDLLRCLAFSGQSNSLFFKEQEGLYYGAQQGKVTAQGAAQLL
jgi:hypothetical protein